MAENLASDTLDGYQRKDSIWTNYSLSVATILVLAGALKAWHAPRILAMNGLLSSEWLLISAILLELVAAVLIVGLSPREAWFLVVAVFAFFAIVASFALISGETCNCFGIELLGAWLTLPLDIIVLIGAVLLRPNVESQRNTRISFFSVAFAVVLAAIGVGLAEYRLRQSESSERLEFLLADELIDKPWPITEAHHPELAQLRTGNWLILIVRSDCEHCQKLIAEHFHDPELHRPGERTAIFIAGSDEWTFRLDHVSLKPGKNSIRWPAGEPFVASPVVFQSVEGIVRHAADSVDSLTFRQLW